MSSQPLVDASPALAAASATAAAASFDHTSTLASASAEASVTHVSVPSLPSGTLSTDDPQSDESDTEVILSPPAPAAGSSSDGSRNMITPQEACKLSMHCLSPHSLTSHSEAITDVLTPHDNTIWVAGTRFYEIPALNIQTTNVIRSNHWYAVVRESFIGVFSSMSVFQPLI